MRKTSTAREGRVRHEPQGVALHPRIYQKIPNTSQKMLLWVILRIRMHTRIVKSASHLRNLVRDRPLQDPCEGVQEFARVLMFPGICARRQLEDGEAKQRTEFI